MEYNLELEKIKDAGFINMIVRAELLHVGDYQMMGARYIDGLSKLLNIRSQLNN